MKLRFIGTVRSVLNLAASALMLAGAAHAADAYPNRPITMVVPNAPGGAVDVTARIIQSRMSEQLAQPIVIDNRAGAGGHIGNALVAKAVPDGYTALACSGSVLLSGVYPRLPYNPMTDLLPIGMYATAGFILVVPSSSPFKSVGDLVAFAKAHPGRLNYGSTGTGNSTHIAAEMINMLAGTKTNHVPYRGSVAALTDLIGGRIDFMFDNKASSLQHIKAGTLRALGVTSAKRSTDMPDVPTVGESLPGFQMEGWIGMFVPKGTDAAVVDKLTLALKKSLADASIAQRVSDVVGEARYMPPHELARYMQEDRARLQRVVDAAAISVE